MADGPPREAVKQADGSFMLQQEDGSTMRWTRRPDGSWRKPEHRRAGYVGELEQQKYVTKGAEIQQQREAQMKAQLGRVPGAAPDDDDGEFSKSKNERKKEKRREKAEEKMEARWAEEQAATAAAEEKAPAAAPAQKVAEAPRKPAGGEKPKPQETEHRESAEASAGNKEKAVRKKLKQIEGLEEKLAAGEGLNEDQLAKIAGKAKLEAELQAVLSGEPVPAAPEAPPQAEPAKAAALATPEKVAPAVAAQEPAPAQAEPAGQPKSKKAIEKKLRQIAEIEEKERAGETLNDDQKSKLANKKQLQAELKSAS